MKHFWRPSYQCHYVIPEIRGNNETLNIILNRILPLRRIGGQVDRLTFLGGYIDGFNEGHKVISTLIKVKEQYEDRVICLLGDHEHLFLKALSGSDRDYQDWIRGGGVSTVQGYLDLVGIKSDASSLPQNRLKDIVPKSHIQFLASLPYYQETQEYFFVHGGVNFKLKTLETNLQTFAFDTVSHKEYARAYRKGEPIVVEKVIVGVHNTGKKPVIYPRYFALGGEAPGRLIALDLNSMEAIAARTKKARPYPFPIKIFE